MGGLLIRIIDKTISGKIAKTIFDLLWKAHTETNASGITVSVESSLDADALIEQQGLKQVTDSSQIEALVDKILEDHPQQLNDYRSGKDKLFGFFVGQVMKVSQGKANPEQVNEILKKKLLSH